MNTACLKKQRLAPIFCSRKPTTKESYQRLHPTGPKSDYNWHTEAMDRAMEGGIDDVGLGVLFGLEGYRYEFAGLLMHAEHLEAVHGVGPHTISVPRVKPPWILILTNLTTAFLMRCSKSLLRLFAFRCLTPA